MLALNDHPWIKPLGERLFEQNYPGTFTLEELLVFLEAAEALLRESDEPMGWVCDFTKIVLRDFTALKRKAFGVFEARCADRDALVCAGAALIVKPSPLYRGMVTAVYWLSPPVYPYRVFSERSEAVEWARASVDARRSAARASLFT